jgi:hypothetical protein
LSAARRLLLCGSMLAGIETAIAFLIILGTMTRILVDDDAR